MSAVAHGIRKYEFKGAPPAREILLSQTVCYDLLSSARKSLPGRLIGEGVIVHPNGYGKVSVAADSLNVVVGIASQITSIQGLGRADVSIVRQNFPDRLHLQVCLNYMGEDSGSSFLLAKPTWEAHMDLGGSALIKQYAPLGAFIGADAFEGRSMYSVSFLVPVRADS